MLVQMVEGIWRMSLTKMVMEFKIKDDAVSDVFGLKSYKVVQMLTMVLG
jgi:hypothetical protein